MRILGLSIVAGVFAVSGWAQSSAGVAGPVTGFIFDTKLGAVRPMVGIPGGAYLGAVMETGLASASVAPDGSAALAVLRNGKLVLYRGLRGAAPSTLVLPGAIVGANLFAWAPDSGSAAVYSSGAAQAQMVGGVAQSPVAAAPIDLSSLPAQVSALAFDGQLMVVGVSSAAAGGIYLASASGGAQRIAMAASPSAIALAGGNLYFADAQSQQISQVQGYAGTPASVVFANDNSISKPTGLQVSSDGLRLYVANAGNNKLVVYDIASRSLVQSLDLAFAPTRLDRFGDTSVFLMNGTDHGPVYVARDGGPGKAAVYFVPSPGKAHPLKAPIRPI